jgi:UDP-N-acetylmuramoyl-L-alanyl-D-glutamate--2,6-diaminopimelate ligase
MIDERSVRLETLLGSLAQNTRVIGNRDCDIRGLAIDSRAVRAGDLFVALRGERTDGHRFIADAGARGAVAVVMEELDEVPSGVTAIVVPDSARALSRIADAFYGSPSRAMTVAGVTGTNGKTTTVHLAASIMNAAGIPAGTIGTLGAAFGERTWPLANTTPLAQQLHELLAQMHELGCKGAAMEVSSHALALQRVNDVRFAVAALTNVTRDHLDFHKSFDAYAAAKRKLFEMAPRCVLNAGDPLGERWAHDLRRQKTVLTYALEAPADLQPDDVEVRADGSRFSIGGQRFDVHVPGRFNVANALCAIGIARQIGVTDAEAARGLDAVRRVAGRMEHLRGAGIDVVVDYAHTPDALENLLRALRETARGRLVAVFGCGGDRDKGKRTQMGDVAARYADFTYVTSDNPRTEDPQAVVDAIVAGMGTAPHVVVLDRRTAIEYAVRDARPGDVIAVAGKGHENYQVVGTHVIPFDDRAVAEHALAAKEAVAS